MVAKAEYLSGGENPRFVVTSFGSDEVDAHTLYEDIYCARGDAENRICEQLELFANQMSTHWTRSNQLRLFVSGLAYIFYLSIAPSGRTGGLGGASAHDDPVAASQDWRTDSRDGASGLDSDGIELSLAAPVSDSFSARRRPMTT